MWGYVEANSPQLSPLFKSCHAPLYLHPSVFFVAEGWQTDLWFFLPFTLFQSFQHPYPSVANLAETWFCGCVTFPHSSSNAFHPYLHPSVANLTEIWQRCGRWICHFSWSPLHFPPVEVHSIGGLLGQTFQHSNGWFLLNVFFTAFSGFYRTPHIEVHSRS